MQMKPRSSCGFLSWKGLGVFNKSNQGVKIETQLFPVSSHRRWSLPHSEVFVMNPVNPVLFSEQPRA